jgi:pimeloyl-ACP methyl ester carboxylesterase
VPVATVDLGPITVAFDDAGVGTPLVLVHGHPFDRSMWRPQFERFSTAEWRVIVPDLRGYGDTSIVPGKTPLATFVGDIAALLDRLGLDEEVLAGLSMGGQIVMEFYRLLPERVRALVLADTSPKADTADGRRARNDAADRLLREGMEPYANEVLPKMIAPANITALPAVAEHVLRMMRRTPPAGAAAALRGRAERPDYVAMLATVTVPTLVVVGRDDVFTPISEAELIAERVPQATLAVIDGAAHMPNLERPDAFNAALADFLDSVSARAATAASS